MIDYFDMEYSNDYHYKLKNAISSENCTTLLKDKVLYHLLSAIEVEHSAVLDSAIRAEKNMLLLLVLLENEIDLYEV
jgi:KaiC/GvpD/RAD55 family RecA-like ATPase